MASNPSNGSSSGADTRKATTTGARAPDGSNGKASSSSRRTARRTSRVPVASPATRSGLPPLETYPAIAIEAVQPEIDGGYWPIKRVVGDQVEVSADIFKEGHDLVQARVLYRALGDPVWRERAMRLVDNDRWVGAFSVDRN